MGSTLSASDVPAIVLPSGLDVHLSRDLQPQKAAFNHPTLSGVWDHHAPEQAMREVVSCLALLERTFSGGTLDAPAITRRCQDAINAGSQDPMVLYALARMANQPPATQFAEYQASYAAFVKSPYPALRRATCALHILQLLHMGGGTVSSDWLHRARQTAASDLMDALADLGQDPVGAVDPVAETSLSILGDDGFYGTDPAESDALLAALAAPRIPPWWSDYLRGVIQIQLAWNARGGGWGSTVTEAMAKAFADHLAQASTFLQAAWALHPDRAFPAIKMITVAMGGDRSAGDELVWFTHAVHARFDDMRAYQALSQAWLPRWAGSYEAMLAVGYAAADTQRFDTNVPWQLNSDVRAVWKDAHSLGEPRP